MSFPIPSFEDVREASNCMSMSYSPQYLMSTSFFDVDRSFDTLLADSLYLDENIPLYVNSSCVVYMGSEKSGKINRFFAIKMSKYKSRAEREYSNYNQIGECVTLTKCYNMISLNDTVYLQLELAEFGSIKSCLFGMNYDEIWRVFACVLVALDVIHDKGYIHMDISPSNILKFSNNDDEVIYKLADLGTMIREGTFSEDCEGAGPYVSPEALEYPNTEFVVNRSSDIFSLGAVLYELVTKTFVPRTVPRYSDFRQGVIDTTDIPDDFCFIVDMLSPTPGERPSTKDLMKIERIRREISEVVV